MALADVMNLIVMLCFQTDANGYGVDWECPTPVAAVTDNFIQLPDCDLREGQLNILQGLNPLTHSEEYGIDIYEQAKLQLQAAI